jgi:hypothetical protein
MKLYSFYTDLCFKQFFENVTTDCNSPCCSVVKSASCELQLPLTVPVPSLSKSRSVTSDVRFTEELLRQFRNRHNSATTENRNHIKISFFGHKDLECHTLQ